MRVRRFGIWFGVFSFAAGFLFSASVAFAAPCAGKCVSASLCPTGYKDAGTTCDTGDKCCLISSSSDATASAGSGSGCEAKGGSCLKVSGGCSAGYACRDELKPVGSEVLCVDGICCKPMTGDALKKCQDAVKSATEGSPTTLKNPLGNANLLQVMANVVKAFLGTVGAFALAVFVYAGVLYLTSAGDAAQITKAKETMKNGVIGLILIIFAYALTSFFVNTLTVV